MQIDQMSGSRVRLLAHLPSFPFDLPRLQAVKIHGLEVRAVCPIKAGESAVLYIDPSQRIWGATQAHFEGEAGIL